MVDPDATSAEIGQRSQNGSAKKTKKLPQSAPSRDTTGQTVGALGAGRRANASSKELRVHLETLFQHGALGVRTDAQVEPAHAAIEEAEIRLARATALERTQGA
jgi:hypothetical protein